MGSAEQTTFRTKAQHSGITYIAVKKLWVS